MIGTTRRSPPTSTGIRSRNGGCENKPAMHGGPQRFFAQVQRESGACSLRSGARAPFMRKVDPSTKTAEGRRQKNRLHPHAKHATA